MYTYTVPGNYVVSLKVDDGNGGVNIAHIAISVGNTPPSASINELRSSCMA